MELETVFWDDQYRNLRDTVRNQVERYEEAVRRRAEQLERATVKERKAKKLLDEVKSLQIRFFITVMSRHALFIIPLPRLNIIPN